MDQMRVLVVDDEEDFLETIVNRLRRRNVDVEGVNNGKTALEVLEHREFDVVILDVKMPGMDGLEVLREMKNRKPLMEVIMLTGHGSVESGIQGMRLGAFDYIMKPADIDDLIEKMRQAYERQQLQRGKT